VAFTRIQSIIEKKNATHPALKEAASLKTLASVWEKDVLALFPKTLRKTIRKKSAVRGFRNATVTVAGQEGALLALLEIRKQEILEAFRRACPEIAVQSVVFSRDELRREEKR